MAHGPVTSSSKIPLPFAASLTPQELDFIAVNILEP